MKLGSMNARTADSLRASQKTMIARVEMTKREAAIVSAYTGILIGEFEEMHRYIEQVVGHPVVTSQLASPKMWELIQEKSRHDFLLIEISA